MFKVMSMRILKFPKETTEMNNPISLADLRAEELEPRLELQVLCFAGTNNGGDGTNGGFAGTNNGGDGTNGGFAGTNNGGDGTNGGIF